jgi:hypothetical protein
MRRLPSFLFPLLMVSVVVVTGLLTYRDYGVGWDEPVQREIGLVNYAWVAHGDTALFSHVNRDYGPAFELLLLAAEKLAGANNFRSIILVRHITIHLFFLLGAFFLFLTARRLYGSTSAGVLSFILLATSPVIYSHSFFNCKDIPFMSAFAPCFYLAVLAHERKRTVHFLLLGACVGLLTGIRVMGLLLFVILATLFVADFLRAPALQRKKTALHLTVYIAGFASALYACWPYLWGDPLGRFAESLVNMARFRWENEVLFSGRFVMSTEVPWYYIPQWFAVTTPLVFLAAGLAGIFVFMVVALRRRAELLSDPLLRHNLVFLLCFAGPVVAVIALGSVLYDGWRQLFFIYPPFVMLAVYAVAATGRAALRKLLMGALAVSSLMPVYFLFRWHPFGHVYFNPLAGTGEPEHIRKSYEMDYWGLSYRQALLYILDHDTSANIRVSSQNPPCDLNLDMLPENDRRRIKMAVITESDYFVTNYRWHPQDYTEQPFAGKEWHSIRVGNNSVNTIFRLKQD